MADEPQATPAPEEVKAAPVDTPPPATPETPKAPATKAQPEEAPRRLETGDTVPCPECGETATAERRTPDHGTHYSIVCAICHLVRKVEG